MKKLSIQFKRILVLSLLTGTTVAGDRLCDRTSREQYVDGWRDAETVRLITSSIFSAGRIKCVYYPDQNEELNLRVMFESGHYEDVEYRIYYTDGSGSIQGQADVSLIDNDYKNNWQLNCRSGTGERPGCSLRKAGLTITRTPDGSSEVKLGERWREGSELLVRVDQNWAVTADAASGFSTQQSRQLVTQMKGAASVDIGYHDRSKQRPTHKTLSLFGLRQALEITDRILAQLTGNPDNGPH